MCNRGDESYNCDEMLKLYIIFNQSSADHNSEGIDNIIATVRWMLDNRFKSSLLAQCLVEVYLQDGKYVLRCFSLKT